MKGIAQALIIILAFIATTAVCQTKAKDFGFLPVPKPSDNIRPLTLERLEKRINELGNKPIDKTVAKEWGELARETEAYFVRQPLL